MNQLFRFFVITVFLAGLVTVGILGTSTSMTFVWPGYLVLGLAGVGSVIAIFRRTKFAIPYWCIGSTFVVLAYLLIRAMCSPVSYFAREDGALLITCFITYAVFLSMMDESRWRKGLFWCFAGLLAGNCLLAGVQLVAGKEIWLLSGYERTFADRIGGLFNNPDHFGGFLAMGMPFIAASVIFGHHKKPVRIGLMVLCAMCFVGIVIAQSLLGLAAAVVGMSILGITTGVLSWKKMDDGFRKSIIYGISAFALAIAAFVSFNGDRLEVIMDKQILTREGELKLPGIWGSSIEQFFESPIAGTGSRTFYFFSRKYRPESEGAAHFETEFVHNEYLQALADYGLIGLVLILTLLAVHFFNGIRFVLGYAKFQTTTALPKSNHLALVAGSIAALGTVAFLSFFDFVMHVPAIAMVVAVLVGVLACPDPMSRALQPKESDTYIPGGWFLFLGRGLAFGCGLALTFYSMIFSRSEWHYEMGRLAYMSGEVNGEQLRHLEAARRIDPINPFAKSLTAHSYIKAIKPTMSDAERLAYLQKAEKYFIQADALYPQDVHSAVAHSVLLDSMGRDVEAGDKLSEARKWAPLHGNLLIAEGEHFLRIGEFDKAENAFALAKSAAVFRDEKAAREGLVKVAEMRDTDGIVTPDDQKLLAGQKKTQSMKTGVVNEVEFSGDLGSAIEKSILELEQKLDAEFIDLPAIEH